MSEEGAGRLELRRVGYTYYDVSFADLLSRESAWCRGRVRTMISRIILHMTMAGSTCVSLLPQHVASWLRIMEDVWSSRHLKTCRMNLLSACEEMGEFRHISIDGTLRVLRRVRGQSDYRQNSAHRALFPIGDADARRRVLSVIGAAGACLSVGLVPDESHHEIAACLQRIWTPSQLASVLTGRRRQCWWKH